MKFICLGNDFGYYGIDINSGEHDTTCIHVTFHNLSHYKSFNYSIDINIFSLLDTYTGTPTWPLTITTFTQYEPYSNEDFIEILQDYTSRIHNTTSFPTSDSSYECTMSFYPFDSNIMRVCLPDLISTCAPDWEDSEVEAMCLAYTDNYCNGSDVYRNPHCAYCNHVDLNETNVCNHRGTNTAVKHYEADFSEIVDWTKLGNRRPHSETEESFLDRQNTTITHDADDGKTT
jgi:hypothetical protein